MNPILYKFDEISEWLLTKYNEGMVITIGILVADCRQDEAKQYIINYVDMFDQNSKKIMDFYIPGYYDGTSNINVEEPRLFGGRPYECLHVKSMEPDIYITRSGKGYYFEWYLFEQFIREMKEKLKINYTYNPMLVLVEVKYENYEVKFQDKLVIELDEDANRGLRRSGQLFDKIFEISKNTRNLREFRYGIRLHYLKGNAIKNIISVLNGEWIEPVMDVVGDVYRFRLKK